MVTLRSSGYSLPLGKLQQSGPFVVPVHAIEVLHGHAAGAADQVVFADENEHAAANQADSDIDEIRAQAILRRREVAYQADERSAAVVGLEQLQELRFGYGSSRHGVDGREDAA